MSSVSSQQAAQGALLHSGIGENVLRRRVSMGREDVRGCWQFFWPERDRRDMFYIMWVRVDTLPQTGEGKGQSRERENLSAVILLTLTSLSASLRNPAQMLLKEPIKFIRNPSEMFGTKSWNPLCFHSLGFLFFFSLLEEFKKCYKAVVICSSCKQENGTLPLQDMTLEALLVEGCMPVFHLTPHNFGCYLRVKASWDV